MSKIIYTETYIKRVKKFIKQNNEKSIKEIIGKFVEKFPEYKKDPDRVYKIAINLMNKPKRYWKKNH